MHQPSSNIAPQHLFDGVSSFDHAFHPSPSLPALHLRHPSPGGCSTSSLAGDRHLELPKTHDQLQQENASLKIRVSELEVINDLFRGTVAQLEQSEAHARRTENLQHGEHNQLRQLLDDSRRREDDLKRRVEDLEREVSELRGSPEPSAKRARLSDANEYPEPPQSIPH